MVKDAGENLILYIATVFEVVFGVGEGLLPPPPYPLLPDESDGLLQPAIVNSESAIARIMPGNTVDFIITSSLDFGGKLVVQNARFEIGDGVSGNELSGII